MNITNVLLTPSHVTAHNHQIAGDLKAPVISSTRDLSSQQTQTLNQQDSTQFSASHSAVTYDRPLAKDANSSQQTMDEKSVDQRNEQKIQDKETEDKEAKQADIQEQYDQQELKQIESLKALDNEVHLHERAHAAVGGQYAGSPTYNYQTGPDGVKYAVSGEVSIDTAKVANDPQATLRKARQIKAAALAPAEPSSQDRRVAAKADRMANQARHDILLDSQAGSDNDKNNSASAHRHEAGIPDHFSEQDNLKKDNSFQESLNKRIMQINNMYQNSTTSKSNSTFQTQI